MAFDILPESRSAHTPGPWHVSRLATDTPNYPGTERTAEVSSSLGIHRVALATIHLRGTAESDNANARLIAAAPDLLSALQFIADNSEQMAASTSADRGLWAACAEQARAAIAKATGAA